MIKKLLNSLGLCTLEHCKEEVDASFTRGVMITRDELEQAIQTVAQEKAEWKLRADILNTVKSEALPHMIRLNVAIARYTLTDTKACEIIAEDTMKAIFRILAKELKTPGEEVLKVKVPTLTQPNVGINAGVKL